MGVLKTAPRALPFVAIMFNRKTDLDNLLKTLSCRLGGVMSAGPVYRVTDFTGYYIKEFGNRLQKQFFIFQNPVNLERFHEIKVWTNDLEFGSSPKPSGRIVNIDPGYLEPSKLVLFSTKNFSHRTYCGAGIFAEVTMLYKHGDFVRLPWTYDDYFWEENRRFLLHARTQIVSLSRKGAL
ncbi:MAG TPA: DUF4416 family protein [Candidatus Marinimicrobia bacterium]|nr:DUF4416 family protein [Candidatus Neomarinimicrobiota bacterium]